MARLMGDLIIDQPSWVDYLPVCAGTTASMVHGRPYSLAVTADCHTVEVQSNRQQLMHYLGLEAPLYWLKQCHSSKIVSHRRDTVADGSTTQRPGCGLVVYTADCLPILLFDASSFTVYAIHVGWCGLLAGILRNVLADLLVYPQYTHAWIGPSISCANYQVDQAFVSKCCQAGYDAPRYFAEKAAGMHVDLKAMACHDLEVLGLRSIEYSRYCTYEEPRCFSHRRIAQGHQGRMASFIYLEGSR